MEKSTVHSIGHGNKKMGEFLEELEHFYIDFLIDVRSNPYSKHNPQFNKDNLERSMRANGISYDWWGDLLGGMPNDESCYTNGSADYSKLAEKDFFLEGLHRLIVAHKRNARMAIMCSEKDPISCHRYQLIGKELMNHNICMMHISRTEDKLRSIMVRQQTTFKTTTTDNHDESIADLMTRNAFN